MKWPGFGNVGTIIVLVALAIFAIILTFDVDFGALFASLKNGLDERRAYDDEDETEDNGDENDEQGTDNNLGNEGREINDKSRSKKWKC